MIRLKNIIKYFLKICIFLFLASLLLTINAVVFAVVDGVTVSTMFFILLSILLLCALGYLLWGKNMKLGWLCFFIALGMCWSFSEFNFDVRTALDIDHCLDLSKTECPDFWDLKAFDSLGKDYEKK